MCGTGCTLASEARPSHANHRSNQDKLEERTAHHWCPRHPWNAQSLPFPPVTPKPEVRLTLPTHVCLWISLLADAV